MSVAFAITCWERDWRQILLHPDYLAKYQIAHHNYPFDEKILIINNVNNLSEVLKAANQKIEEGILDRVVIAKESILNRFQMNLGDFYEGSVCKVEKSPVATVDFLYHNAIGPLTALYATTCDYLLYQCGDIFLTQPTNWVKKATDLLKKDPLYKVATLVWNWGDWLKEASYDEVRRESFKLDGEFYVTNCRFSDHLFLVKRSDFYAPIYKEPREDVTNYPWGDTFEMRMFSAMKTRGWLEIIYAHGDYTHRNIEN